MTYLDNSIQFIQTILFSEIEGFFNLLFSHFLTLLPLDAPETKERLDTLLQTITSTESPSSTKYRMYNNSSLSLNLADGYTAFPTSSMLSLDRRA